MSAQHFKSAITKCPQCKRNYSKEEVLISRLFNLCPYCGRLFERSINSILRFVDLIELHKNLASTYSLLQKGELTAAAREALVTLESNVRKKSGLLNLRGRALMSRAFSFEYDSGKNRIVRRLLKHLGYNVIKLDRVAYAGITKKGLPVGKCRPLNDLEIEKLRKA